MTPAETAAAVAYAHEQWPHYTITPRINDIWHQHLQRTDPRIVRQAIDDLLGIIDRPPTVAQIKTQTDAIIRRAGMNRAALPAGRGQPVSFGSVRCRADCEWVLDLEERHTTTTWAALTSEQRILELRAHARHHTDHTVNDLRIRLP